MCTEGTRFFTKSFFGNLYVRVNMTLPIDLKSVITIWKTMFQLIIHIQSIKRFEPFQLMIG
jgi:hypothetical protein